MRGLPIVAPNGYKIEVLDFSDEFFRQKGMGIPQRRGGKFVVMRDDNRKWDYLVLSPAAQSIYHADIVEQFCQLERFGISGTMLKKSSYFVIDDPNWSVAGGGRWDWLETERRLRLFGSSQAYGATTLGSLKKRLAKVPEMAGWRIELERVNPDE